MKMKTAALAGEPGAKTRFQIEFDDSSLERDVGTVLFPLKEIFAVHMRKLISHLGLAFVCEMCERKNAKYFRIDFNSRGQELRQVCDDDECKFSEFI